MTEYYLAAPFTHKAEAKAARAIIGESLGWECTSTWLDNHNTDFAALSDGTTLLEAVSDVDDIQASDCMVFLNLGPSEGKMFELGCAVMDDIPVYFIGKPTHIFHFLVPVSKRYETLEEFVTFNQTEKGYGHGV